MALLATITLPNQLTVQDAYIQVERFTRFREGAEIHINIFSSAKAREEKAAPVHTSCIRVLDTAEIELLEGYMVSTKHSGTRDIERCYLYLKEKVATFDQATDA